jgi:hypothetical protein
MVLSIIFLEDKDKMLLHLSIFYEYQQFFQHRICFSIQPPDIQWPVTHFSTFYQFILNMLFKHAFTYTRSINRTLKIPEYVMILVISLWIQPKCDTIYLTEKSSSVCLITENVSLKYQYRNLWNYIYDLSSPFRQIF